MSVNSGELRTSAKVRPAVIIFRTSTPNVSFSVWVQSGSFTIAEMRCFQRSWISISLKAFALPRDRAEMLVEPDHDIDGGRHLRRHRLEVHARFVEGRVARQNDVGDESFAGRFDMFGDGVLHEIFVGLDERRGAGVDHEVRIPCDDELVEIVETPGIDRVAGHELDPHDIEGGKARERGRGRIGVDGDHGQSGMAIGLHKEGRMVGFAHTALRVEEELHSVFSG